MKSPSDRRRHPRYVLPSMYTAVDVRPVDAESFQWSGHCYDISEGGMRFELDEPVAPGKTVVLRIELPGAANLPLSERRPVFALANVVWLEEEDVNTAGPVRMACVFTHFVQPGDKERLMSRLASGRFSLAA